MVNTAQKHSDETAYDIVQEINDRLESKKPQKQEHAKSSFFWKLSKEIQLSLTALKFSKAYICTDGQHKMHFRKNNS